MGYLGNTPGESFISFAKQVFTIVNSQTAYTLDFAVVDENELRLVVNNVVQEPGSGKAYTASGTTLTLSAALTNGTDEMYCVFLGKARETVTVPTITKDKLNLISTSSSAGLEVKGDGTTDGTLQLNCSQNSHGIKLASPPHSAGQSYTLTFPQSISADTFLKTDGSGNLSFASAGGTNTPAFYAYQSSGQVIADTTDTTINFQTEVYDTASAFASNTFTVPSGEGGKYHFFFSISKDNFSATRFNVKLDAAGTERAIVENASGGNYDSASGSVVIPLSAGDAVFLKCYQDSSGANNLLSGQKRTWFGGYKIIE